MAESTRKLIGNVNKGDSGMPGQGATMYRARVYLLKPGRYEMALDVKSGSNQGYMEWHYEYDAKVRADSISGLVPAALEAIRGDEHLDDARLKSAIREACYEAEDAACP